MPSFSNHIYFEREYLFRLFNRDFHLQSTKDHTFSVLNEEKENNVQMMATKPCVYFVPEFGISIKR